MTIINKNIMTKYLIILIICSTVFANKIDIFKANTLGYNSFRIPVLINVDGVLIAFAEGRKNKVSDYGNIDTVMKRSFDGGKTWTDMKIIADDGTNYIGIPSPVYDKKHNKLIVLLTRKNGKDNETKILNNESLEEVKIFEIYSLDKGASWSKPEDVTKQVKNSNWTWYSTGPAKGVQLNNGRLIIPANHSVFFFGGKNDIKSTTRSHLLYSDDSGLNWHIGAISDFGTNEATVCVIGGGGNNA